MSPKSFGQTLTLALWRPLLPYVYSYKASCDTDRVKSSFVIFDIWAECPDVKNYKWQLNPVWHRVLYSSTHMATVGIKGLESLLNLSEEVWQLQYQCLWSTGKYGDLRDRLTSGWSSEFPSCLSRWRTYIREFQPTADYERSRSSWPFASCRAPNKLWWRLANLLGLPPQPAPRQSWNSIRHPASKQQLHTLMYCEPTSVTHECTTEMLLHNYLLKNRARQYTEIIYPRLTFHRPFHGFRWRVYVMRNHNVR